MQQALRVGLVAAFLAGAGLRAIDLWHPVDGTVRESWRECDIASIARNYYREDSRFLYPRIDWRGDGPGYTEMELPITPWSISVLYRVFGFHEVAGRILVYVFSLLTLVVFFRLAVYLLPPGGAAAASLFFVLSPLAVRISNTLQPEAFMFLTYILAVYGFVRWLDTNRWRDWGLTLVATSLTILAKASAAHIGILFAVLLISRRGWGVLRRPSVWALAVLSLAPPLLWYAYARGFWIHYGNSLGVSNEYHWIGWDFFTNRAFIMGILVSEVFYVWMPSGLLVAALGIIMRYRERGTQVALAWLGAVAVFYVVASRTTGDDWAIYYHVVSVPSVALLFGVGVDALGSLSWRPGWGKVVMAAVAAVLAVLCVVHFAHLDLGFGAGAPLRAAVAAALVAFVALAWYVRNKVAPEGRTPVALKAVVLATWMLAAVTVSLQAREVLNEAHPDTLQASFDCARQFAPLIPPGDLVVVSGGPCTDTDGYPVAYNEPYMFYWMDRKGFSLCEGDQSVRAVTALSKRGARFYVAKKSSLHGKPGYEHALRATYPVLSECSKFVLFSLQPHHGGPSAQ